MNVSFQGFRNTGVYIKNVPGSQWFHMVTKLTKDGVSNDVKKYQEVLMKYPDKKLNGIIDFKYLQNIEDVYFVDENKNMYKADPINDIFILNDKVLPVDNNLKIFDLLADMMKNIIKTPDNELSTDKKYLQKEVFDYFAEECATENMDAHFHLKPFNFIDFITNIQNPNVVKKNLKTSLDMIQDFMERYFEV